MNDLVETDATRPVTNRKRQMERRADAERRLIDAAAELIGEIGPARVTLADIGERAGYSRGLATHYFGTKGALLQRIVDTVTDEFTAVMSAIPSGDSALQSIHIIVDTYFDSLSVMTPMTRARLVLWADSAANSTHHTNGLAAPTEAHARAIVEQRVDHGRQTGELASKVDPRSFSILLLAMLRGVALQTIISDDVDLEACRVEVLQIVDARLTTHRA